MHGLKPVPFKTSDTGLHFHCLQIQPWRGENCRDFQQPR